MGDPTLTMHVVTPPSDLEVQQPRDGEVQLEWSPSADAGEGYHIYRAPGVRGVFDRITTDAVQDTSFTDPSPLPGSNVYMVRALKLEESSSGSYYKLSGGIVDSLIFATGVAAEPRLSYCHPNPFTTGTTIHYVVPTADHVRLRIFTVAGREVTQLVDRRFAAGSYTSTWDGTDGDGRRVASGVYFCRLEVGDRSVDARLVVLR